MTQRLKDMYQELIQAIQQYQRVIVAYSGGVDSSLVLKACVDALGSENVLAVIATSQLDERDISQEAALQANQLKSPYRIIQINELDHPMIRTYHPEAWYYSKQMLYQVMTDIQRLEGYDVIMDGMIMNDLQDFRPGLKARDEAHVVSILQQVGIYKSQVRELLKMLAVDIWSKPSSCSLLSRFEYGQVITETALDMIRKGEAYLRELGFEICRVRIHGNLARIEVAQERFSEMVGHHERIQAFFSDHGFDFVTLDMKGYQSGRMNQTLSQDVLAQYQRKVDGHDDI